MGKWVGRIRKKRDLPRFGGGAVEQLQLLFHNRPVQGTRPVKAAFRSAAPREMFAH